MACCASKPKRAPAQAVGDRAALASAGAGRQAPSGGGAASDYGSADKSPAVTLAGRNAGSSSGNAERPPAVGGMSRIIAGFPELTPEQIASCHALRQRVPPDDEGIPTDEMVCRFMRATVFRRDENHRDPERRGDWFAERLLQRHCEWRREIKPDALTANDCGTAMGSGAARFLGVGTVGNPILWAQASLWNPHEYDVDEFVRYTAFYMAQG